MEIVTHRKDSINLKLFLETLGFETYFNEPRNGKDVLLVSDEDRPEFLESVRDYVEQWGYTPYHYSLTPDNQGTEVKGKIEFYGRATVVTEFNSVQGRFTLVLFEGEDGRNYLWKTYTQPTLPPDRIFIKGRLKAVIKGINGEVINLITHATWR